MKKIDIYAAHKKIILELLQTYLPPSTKIWAFGSRTTGRAKKFSDLDLAIDGSQPLSFSILTKLVEAFEESPLPYKVDLVDYQTISGSFKEKIQHEKILFYVCNKI